MVTDDSEFSFIAELETLCGPTTDLLGIGDDAAAWIPTPGSALVATSDALVEGTHFRLDWTDPADLGWKALAANLSDLAAMGAQPGRALVTVAMSPDHRSAVLDAYRGMRRLAEQTQTRIVGGDVARSPGPLMLSVALLGEADPDRLLRRDAARPGDLLAVSGVLGSSAAALELLVKGRLDDLGESRVAAPLLAAHHRPRPRLDVGERLVAAGARCAIDISDGLVSEAGHLAASSGVLVEIEIEHVPLHPAAVELLGFAHARRLALTGGEDYELLFSVDETDLTHLGDLPGLTVVGRVVDTVPGGEVRLSDGGRHVDVAETGYRAF